LIPVYMYMNGLLDPTVELTSNDTPPIRCHK
jgi:hypothetical protein